MASETARLDGRSVLITRAKEQAAGLISPLEALGADVLVAPVISVVDPDDFGPLDESLGRLHDYDWLVLTSTNGVDRFFDRAALFAGASEGLAQVRVAAVGSATASRMRERGIEPDFVPKDFRAEGLLEGFRELGVGPGTRILIARAEEAREILPARLRDMGADVDVVTTYRVVPIAPPDDVVARLAAGTVDVAAFASGGTFRNYLDALEAAGLDAGDVTRSLDIASIGPVTSEAVRRAGFDVAAEAPRSTMESLVETIARKWGTP